MAVISRSRARAIAEQFRVLRERHVHALASKLRGFFVHQSDRVVSRYLSGKTTPWLSETKENADNLLPSQEDLLMLNAVWPDISDQWLQSANLAATLVGTQPTNAEDVRLQAYLRQAGTRAVDINNTTREAIRGVLSAGLDRGYGQYYIAHGAPADPDKGWPEPFVGLDGVVQQIYRGRSDTIARTELAHASNDAAVARYGEAGVTQIEINDGGGDTSCDECDARDGDIVDIADTPDEMHPSCSLVLIPVV